MRRFYKKRYLLGIVVVGTLGAFLVWRMYRAPVLPAFESATVTRGDIVHEVSVTGKVEPAKRVELGFISGGKIDHLLVAAGDRVEAGQALASLDSNVLASQLREAQAGVVREERTLTELKNGSRSEDVAVTQASLDAAQKAYVNTADGLHRVIERAFVVADDAVRQKADMLFDNPRSAQPSFGIDFTQDGTHYAISANNETRSTLNALRKDITARMDAWQKMNTVQDASLVAEHAAQAKQHLETVQDLLNRLGGVVNGYSAADSKSQIVYANYQTAIASARSSVSLILGELKTATDAYSSAASALEVAQRQLTLKQAGPTDDVLAVQDAVIERARNAVKTLQAQLTQTTLVSPITGIVTDITAKRGESVSPNAVIVSIMSPSSFELTAYIPESDIVQVHVGDEASVTFDALDQSEVSHARVAHIDDGETMREGVATYKTTLALDSIDERIRSGMSADINITTDSHKNVLILPQRSIVNDNARKYVRIPSGTTFAERDVRTGLRGSDGNIEVLDGVTEGEKVVLYVEK